MNKALLSSKNMCWCTPQDFFDKLNEEFSFTLDAAATDKTAKCPLYFTPETDGLKSSWKVAGGVQYFAIPRMGAKSASGFKRHTKRRRPERRLFFSFQRVPIQVPARTDTSYFHDFIYHKAEIRFIRGRLRFTDDDGNAADPAPFPSMLVIYNGKAVKS